MYKYFLASLGCVSISVIIGCSAFPTKIYSSQPIQRHSNKEMASIGPEINPAYHRSIQPHPQPYTTAEGKTRPERSLECVGKFCEEESNEVEKSHISESNVDGNLGTARRDENPHSSSHTYRPRRIKNPLPISEEAYNWVQYGSSEVKGCEENVLTKADDMELQNNSNLST